MQDLPVVELVAIAAWFVAGVIALYFSVGSARIWTAISTGFLLVFVSESYFLFPWVRDPRLTAIHLIVGTIAVLVLTHGFQEYYVFSRTMEAGGSKGLVYVTTAGVIAASLAFVLVNPAPGPAVLRHIALVGNVNWVFLALINLDIVRRIYRQVQGSAVAPGFLCFGVVFGLIVLWRGAELYLQVYAWDPAWRAVLADAGVQVAAPGLARVAFSELVHRVAGLGSSLAVAGTFLFLLRRLR